jgi:predicted DNA-binding transcriptional regulator YafY
VSLRTVYPDLRSLALAGVPLLGKHGVGYLLVDGYRLSPILFTREEAMALLVAERMVVHLTDAPTARLAGVAMNKVRAMLRRPNRDYLTALA